MNRIQKLMEEHGLETDGEHIIIPYLSSTGERRRIYLLNREHMILEHGKDIRITVPVWEVVEAILKNPEGSLWETMGLSERLRHHLHANATHEEPTKEGGDQIPKHS